MEEETKKVDTGSEVEHNADSPYHNECKALTNQFLMNYKPQNLMGAVI